MNGVGRSWILDRLVSRAPRVGLRPEEKSGARESVGFTAPMGDRRYIFRGDTSPVLPAGSQGVRLETIRSHPVPGRSRACPGILAEPCKHELDLKSAARLAMAEESKGAKQKEMGRARRREGSG